MSELHYGRGYVYSIQYHIVWCVKYRHDILVGKLDTDLKNILNDIALENNIKILEMETDKDHIHLLIECKPQHYIPNIIKALKGASAKRIFMLHPKIKNKLWGGHLWNPSYFIVTVSENTETHIREYIKNQKKK